MSAVKPQRTGRRGEIRYFDHLAADPGGGDSNLRMRTRQERVQQAEFAYHLQGRRVDRIAAEVAQKVGVLFQNNHVHPGARQE